MTRNHRKQVRLVGDRTLEVIASMRFPAQSNARAISRTFQEEALRVALDGQVLGMLVESPNLKISAAEVKNAARQLADAANHAELADIPAAKRAGTKKAMRELEELSDLCWRLLKRIVTLHGDALHAMNDPLRGDNEDPIVAVGRLFEAAMMGTNRLRAAPWEDPPRDNKRRERPKAVTRCAAEVYERLTGNPATVVSMGKKSKGAIGEQKIGGAFVRFLAAVFQCVGIPAAKAPAQAKEFRDSWLATQRMVKSSSKKIA
jgi:hypothetical protein